MKKRKFKRSITPIILFSAIAGEALTETEVKAKLDQKFLDVNKKINELTEKGAEKAEIEVLTKALKKQGDALQEFIDEQKRQNEGAKTFEEAFEKFLVKNQTKLEEIAKSRTGNIEFIFDAPITDKAVGSMTTGSGGDVSAAPVNHNTRLSRIKLRDDNPLINLCNVIRTNSPSFPYTETEPKDGDYTFVAEGAKKPQIDFKWSVRYAEPYKIAAYEVFTEEVVRDIPRLMDTAKGYLKDRHDLFKANAIYFADGSAGKPTGATVLARAFVAGGMANKIVDPTIMDVINAVITDIHVTHNYQDELPYRPNLVLMNPVDYFVFLKADKDNRRLPLYDVSMFNGFKKDGVTVRPWEEIPAGKIFVGDMSKYNISNWVRYSVRIGWINEQFINNEFTMVGESRFHAFVKNFDKQAFVYDDIATIAAAIKAPATAQTSGGGGN